MLKLVFPTNKNTIPQEGTACTVSPSAPQDLGDPDDPTHREREKTDHHETHSFLEPFHSALLMISYTTVDRPLHGSLGAEAPRNCAILTPG